MVDQGTGCVSCLCLSGGRRAWGAAAGWFDRLRCFAVWEAVDGAPLLVGPDDSQAVRLAQNDEAAAKAARAVALVDDGQTGPAARLDRAGEFTVGAHGIHQTPMSWL